MADRAYRTRRRIPLDGQAYHTMRWLREELLQRGLPVRLHNNGKILRLGPLTVYGVPQMQLHVVRNQHSDKMTVPEGQAAVVVTAARDKPDRLKGAQVVMNLESLVQILTWLADADPDSFLRPPTNKGMKYDNDTTHRVRRSHEPPGLGREGMGASDA